MKETICHISTVHPAFDQRIFHRQCISLSNAGYDTHLIVQHSQAEETVKNVHLHAVGAINPNPGGIKIFHRLRRILRATIIAYRLKAKIYHLHDLELIPLGVFLKIITSAKVVFDSHENNIGYIQQKHYIPKWLRKILQVGIWMLEWIASRLFDAIVTADQGVAEIFRQQYKAKQQVVVIHNFPRLDLFLNVQLPADSERQYDLVYHGTIPKYHLEIAFDIAEELKQRNQPAKWLFFGRCLDIDWANDQLKKRDLQDVFSIDPNLIPHEEVAQRVAQAQIGFIPLPDLPKFQQNIPTKLFEFMALKMPVILSDLPPSRPFVDDGVSAIMIKPDDINAYADAITRLLTDKTLRENMGQAGYQKVMDGYSWENEVQLLYALYESLI